MIGIAFSPTRGSISAIPNPCKSTSITMCFDDEGRHHGGNEESSALWWAPNPSTPACKHKWHRSRRCSLRSSSRVPLPPPSPTPTLPAPPVLARPDETDETDVLERPVLARPLSDETDETDVLARPLSDETDETDVLERPLSDETDETDVLARPLLALIGKGSGDDVAGRRRGRTCNRAQSRTIRRNQGPAIERNQFDDLQSVAGPAIERNQLRSEVIKLLSLRCLVRSSIAIRRHQSGAISDAPRRSSQQVPVRAAAVPVGEG